MKINLPFEPLLSAWAEYADSGGLDRKVHLLHYTIEYYRLRNKIRRERQQLLDMPDERLRDIGLDRYQVIQQAARTDIPANRLKELQQLVKSRQNKQTSKQGIKACC